MEEPDQPAQDPYQHLRDRYWDSPFLKYLSFQVGRLEPGKAEVRLPVVPELLNRNHAVHGGVVASLLDSALAQAILTQVKPGTSIATIELKVNYLAPARGAELVADAEAIQVGGTVAVASSFVHGPNGERFAMAVGTFRLFGERTSPRETAPSA